MAAWIAYGPKDVAPDYIELRLLRKFLRKVGGGVLPARLQEVLQDVQALLQSTPRDVHKTLLKEQQKLQQSLTRFRCCRLQAGAVQPTDRGLMPSAGQQYVLAQPNAMGNAAPLLPTSDTYPSTCSNSSGHLRLFRKMNEWGFLDNAEKLRRLGQAEEAVKRQRRSLNQAELAKVIDMVAAALAAPRRQVAQQEAEEAAACAEGTPQSESNGLPGDVQRRLRALLLATLRRWLGCQFDCHAIGYALEHINGRIKKFEDNMGDIRGAAGGFAWHAIKRAVDQVLQGPAEHSKVQPATSVVSSFVDDAKGRQERQSGVQNISWNSRAFYWCISWCEDSKQHKIIFPITRFMKQGLDEDAAIEAALQEARDRREALVREGKLRPARPMSIKTSPVRGVWFDKQRQKWHVQLLRPDTRERYHVGYFTAQEEAEAKARETAKKFGLKAETEVVPMRKRSELPHFEPLGPQKTARAAKRGAVEPRGTMLACHLFHQRQDEEPEVPAEGFLPSRGEKVLGPGCGLA